MSFGCIFYLYQYRECLFKQIHSWGWTCWTALSIIWSLYNINVLIVIISLVIKWKKSPLAVIKNVCPCYLKPILQIHAWVWELVIKENIHTISYDKTFKKCIFELASFFFLLKWLLIMHLSFSWNFWLNYVWNTIYLLKLYYIHIHTRIIEILLKWESDQNKKVAQKCRQHYSVF